MHLLFVLFSLDEKLGGGVYAPLIIKRSLLAANLVDSVDIYAPNKFLADKTPLNSKASLKKILSDRKYDLVVIHGVWSSVFLQAMFHAVMHGVPFLIQPHGSLDRFDVQKKLKLKLLLGSLLKYTLFRLCSGFVFTSSKEINSSIFIPSSRYVATASLTTPKSAPLFRDYTKEDFCKEYNIAKDTFLLLFLSRVDYKKGLDVLLCALSKLKGENWPVHLLIAGSGNYEYTNHIQELICSLQCDTSVTWMGHVEGNLKEKVFLSSDLYILPSLNENFGLTVVEAIAHNLPVLITKNVYIWETIINSASGFLCERNDISISETVSHLIRHPELLESAKKACQMCIQQHFSSPVCAHEHYNAYLKALQNKRVSLFGKPFIMGRR